MLSDEQIKAIQLEKTRKAFDLSFILRVDSDWNMAVSRLKRSGADLAAIPIAAAPKEYKNVRT